MSKSKNVEREREKREEKVITVSRWWHDEMRET